MTLLGKLSILAGLLAFASPPGSTATIGDRGLGADAAKATLAVVVEIVAATKVEREIHTDLVVVARPVRTIVGSPLPGTTWSCTFSQGKPHRRGDRFVEPRSMGSGIEFGLHAGDQVILLVVAGAADAADCSILRAEPLSRESQVRRPLR
ncbi:hypothetical protein BH09PSE6_BH09PSE6_14790 [soil metagenome]